MARVYLETSFISACVTTRTDPGSLYRRAESLEWWNSERNRHELWISAEVIRELSEPDYPTRDAALQWVAELPLLPITPDVAGFAEVLIRERVMPSPPLEGDALHVALACVHNFEYVLNWNVRHLANRNKITHLRTICLRADLIPPQIITPPMLFEESTDDTTKP